MIKYDVVKLQGPCADAKRRVDDCIVVEYREAA